MEVVLILVSLFSLTLVLLILMVSYKIVKNKTFPDNFYTPFDSITAQAPSEFHEEKEEEKEEEDEQRNDKGKNK
ncbi:DUF3951 domain-containing protein [Cytobacillus sp. Hm23]